MESNERLIRDKFAEKFGKEYRNRMWIASNLNLFKRIIQMEEKMSEFNLSEKIMYSEIGGYDGEISVSDVKEAIKILKSKKNKEGFVHIKEIDKIFGGK